MHVLYVDEAGDGGTSHGSSKHLVLAGAAMHEAQWHTLKRTMDDLQQHHFPTAGSTLELHASLLRAGRGVFRGLPKRQRLAAMEDIYRKIGTVQRGLTLFAAVVDKQAFTTLYKNRVDPYSGAFESLCTMFNLFLKNRQRYLGRAERGIVVIDESSPSLSNQLRNLLARFQATGTSWSSLGNVIETPFFFDSKTSRMMQVADFTSYAVFRWYESNDDAYLKCIHNKFDKDRAKCHGLKCYPLTCTKSYPPPPPGTATVA
jgi:Protein of unknown function (DUF3800)